MPSKTENAGTFGDLQKPNQLDPGPPRRRKTKLGCRCVLYAAFSLMGLAATWAAYRTLTNKLALYRDPYDFLYQDPKEAHRPQDIVRPLIDRNQTFDVVATVWLRFPKKVVSEYEVDWYKGGRMMSRQNLKLEETAIFSDTVFKGLRLQDKNKKTSVNIQVPTEIFKLRELNNYDLRASFVLIPNSPSLLDNASFYSTWIPSEAQYPPMRPWPIDTAAPSLADKIVDSYGAFTPLLAFHGIESKCPGSSQPEDFDEEEMDAEEDDIILSFGVAENRKNWVSTKGKPVLSSHPYIVTRSFLRIVNMTKIFNKAAFDGAHAKLKSFSCGTLSTINGLRSWASWKDCIHSYYVIGNHAVKIRLSQVSGNTGKERTEWAYAPHLSLADNTWGPKDLVPVPVNRQTCVGDEADESPEVPALPESPSVNITWNIAFSGINLFELSAGNAVAQAMPPHNMTDAEHALVSQHALMEYAQGLAGHRFRDDFHPRREIALSVIRDIFHAIAAFLNILYWYTRSSTSGISITGTALQIASTVLTSIAMVAFKVLQDEGLTFAENLKYFYMLNALFTAALMLKAIARAEIRWWKRVVPIVVRAPATHAERTSQRIEARTPHRSIVLAYLVLSGVFYVIHHQEYYIIAPRYMYGESFKSALCKFLFWAPDYLLRFPLGLLSQALQLLLNYRMKTFAGMYKASVGVVLAAAVCEFAGKVPWVIGESRNAWPWTYFDLLRMCGLVVYAAQAWRYVSVASLDEDEDDAK